MEKSAVDKTQLERPYTFFLFKSLAGIYESWDEGAVQLALSRACRLVVFLPNDVKDVLWVDKEEIQKIMSEAGRRGKTNFYMGLLNSSKQSRAAAGACIEPFMDKMIRLLDEKGWLERGAMRPRYPTAKKLSVESIET